MTQAYCRVHSTLWSLPATMEEELLNVLSHPSQISSSGVIHGLLSFNLLATHSHCLKTMRKPLPVQAYCLWCVFS